MTEPHKILAPEEIKNTYDLQLDSLIMFAEELGFYRNCCFGNAGQFFSVHKGLETVSLSTMVDLYNSSAPKYSLDLYGNRRNKTAFKLNEYRWTRANAVKIVNRVFLQFNKKTQEIQCHKHIVSFPHQSYEELFLKNLK